MYVQWSIPATTSPFPKVFSSLWSFTPRNSQYNLPSDDTGRPVVLVPQTSEVSNPTTVRVSSGKSVINNFLLTNDTLNEIGRRNIVVEVGDP